MPPVFPGLCADCAFSRVIDTGRSTFYMCELALTDPRFAKYPPLPVLACPGYQLTLEVRLKPDATSRRDDPGSPADPEPDDKLNS